MFHLRLKEGMHIQNDKDGNEVTYVAPATFECENDLAKRWPEKFERATFDEPPTDPFSQKSGETFAEYQRRLNDEMSKRVADAHQRQLSTLDTMSLEELRKHCAEEEIDISGAESREQVLEVVKAHHGQN